MRQPANTALERIDERSGAEFEALCDRSTLTLACLTSGGLLMSGGTYRHGSEDKRREFQGIHQNRVSKIVRFFSSRSRKAKMLTVVNELRDYGSLRLQGSDKVRSLCPEPPAFSSDAGEWG